MGTYQIIYTWPNGKEEIRYSRPVTDCKLAWEVVRLHRLARKGRYKSPYSIKRLKTNGQ